VPEPGVPAEEDADYGYTVDYKFSRKRCGNKYLRRAGKNQCGGCDSNPSTGTCSLSWQVDDARKWKSPDAACRCNPSTNWFANKVDSNKCEWYGPNACLEEDTCHVSFPYYDALKGDSPDRDYRCKAAGDHSGKRYD